MCGKKKYIEMFGSFMEPFNCNAALTCSVTKRKVVNTLCIEQVDDGYHRGKYSIEIFLTEYVCCLRVSLLRAALQIKSRQF